MVKKKYISLEEIISNVPRDLVVSGIGTISVRDPTTEDRIQANKNAKSDPRWEDLDDAQKSALVMDMLAIKMLVEPVVTVDDYYKTNSVLLSNIIDAVIMEYYTKLNKLQSKRSKEITNFLDLMKGNSPKSSTIS